MSPGNVASDEVTPILSFAKVAHETDLHSTSARHVFERKRSTYQGRPHNCERERSTPISASAKFADERHPQFFVARGLITVTKKICIAFSSAHARDTHN